MSRVPPLEYTVRPTDPRTRIDQAALAGFPVVLTRSQARKLCKKGLITLNGEKVDSSRFVHPGDRLQLLPQEQSNHPVYPLEVSIIYEDDAMAMVIKPPGLPVNGNRHRTLEHALPHNLKPSGADDALACPRPVHRIDHRTGGLVVIAKRQLALLGLTNAFMHRRVEKRYFALVAGKILTPFTVNSSIDGRDAVTHFQPERCIPSLHIGDFTQIWAQPVTGRTHQIRIHLAESGHPILGDDLHVGPDALPVLRRHGLFLWAQKLSFNHPVTDQRLTAEAPVPPKYERFCERELRRWKRFHSSDP